MASEFRPYFDLERASEFVRTFESRAELADDPDYRPAVSRDPTDDYLIALARSATVDALVSGDHDLLTLRLVDLRILSLRELLDLLE